MVKVYVSYYLRQTFQEVGDVAQLWNVVLAEAAVVNEQRKDVVKLLARMGRVQRRQLAKHCAPATPPCSCIQPVSGVTRRYYVTPQ